MMKLKSKRFQRTLFKFRGGSSGSNNDNKESGGIVVAEIKWEVRPGGMLVQKRDIEVNNVEKEGFIMVRVATAGSQWHDISVRSTSTFGEMKMLLSMVTGIEPKEQRVLFKGKERDDVEHLHMVGVGDKDKVVMLEDPAIKERKLHGLNGASNHAISV